jgi:hypothetical protein
MPKFSDCRIVGKVVVDDTNTLTFKIECPPGGWDETGRQVVILAKKDWTPTDFEITGMDTPTDKTKDEERAKKRSTLAVLMEIYDKETPRILRDGLSSVEKVYKKYDIKSRTELTDAQLDYEIESYKTALQNNAA